ncbi:MAG TPA: poly-beta-1,6-N-acetyl-D-glucosamine N-deacetylase, partial [Chromatiales bacterium]|nr:poly-beta-1,6-N-acetyl-D-glucosamine N-deacetylase [Chromatiales bacterium]
MLIIIWSLLGVAHAQPPSQRFITLSYHDVSDDAALSGASSIMFIKSAELVSQFAWLREQGYQPVSMEQIIAARNGGTPLPDRAILLSFDDGYRSVYTRVFPLLKLFNYPAVIALVGKWMDVPAGEMVAYGDEQVPREYFLEWHEVNEMVSSGLVEVA